MTEYPILTLPPIRGKNYGRLYYYQGNFFHPLILVCNQPGLIARGIREFARANRDMIARDRSRPEYRTLEQLLDDQYQQNKNTPT